MVVDKWAFFHRARHSDLLLLSFLHNVFVGPRVLSRLVSFRQNSPRTLRVISFPAPFTTTHRMVDRVHCNSANVRTATKPARATRLSYRYILMVEVAYLSNRGPTFYVHPTNFSGGKFHCRVVPFFRH